MKEMEPACNQLHKIGMESGSDFMHGKSLLTLKAVCAIYSNMVNKVASGADEGLDI
jgi:hypothetical protein